MALKTLAIAKLRTDGGTQLRVMIVHEHVANLTDAFRDDGKRKAIPPIEVIFDSVDYWVWDGNHRILAAQEAGQDTILCNVEKGTQRDAILKAAGANQNHGMPRSNLDKRKAIGALLEDPEWVKSTDRWIAETCGVNHHLVAEVRKATASQLGVLPTEKRQGRDGKQYLARRRPSIPTPSFIDEEPDQGTSGGAEPVSSGPLAEMEADPAGVDSEPTAGDIAGEFQTWLQKVVRQRLDNDNGGLTLAIVSNELYFLSEVIIKWEL